MHLFYPIAETTRDQIEETFEKFIARGDVGLIIINQPVADQIRARLAAHTYVFLHFRAYLVFCSFSLVCIFRSPFPMVLEIPSKDTPYDINKDPMMKRITQMLGEDA